MKTSPGYIPIAVWYYTHKTWGTDILKLQPFENICIQKYGYRDGYVIIESGRAIVKTLDNTNINLAGYRAIDFIKFIKKLGEVYGAHEDLAEAIGKQAIQYDERGSLLEVKYY